MIKTETFFCLLGDFFCLAGVAWFGMRNGRNKNLDFTIGLEVFIDNDTRTRFRALFTAFSCFISP